VEEKKKKTVVGGGERDKVGEREMREEDCTMWGCTKNPEKKKTIFLRIKRDPVGVSPPSPNWSWIVNFAKRTTQTHNPSLCDEQQKRRNKRTRETQGPKILGKPGTEVTSLS